MKKIFLIILLGSLVFPSVGLAGTYIACQDDSKNWRCEPTETATILVYSPGLVPCGGPLCKIDSSFCATSAPCTGKCGVKLVECYLAEDLPFIDPDNPTSNDTACGKANGIGVAGQELKSPSGDVYYVGVPCQFCHFFVMLDGIIDFVLFQLVPVIAVLMLVIAGVMYIGAVFELIPGGWETFSRAKKIFTSIIIGLVIIYAGWLVINLFFNVIEVADWTGLRGGWFSIKCLTAVALPPY